MHQAQNDELVVTYICCLVMKRAIVLMNLGSPDCTDVTDVNKYLDEFLMDERVIDKPWVLRALLVKGIIVPFRAPKSASFASGSQSEIET